ncbi:hypothetical protein ABPG77_000740 [Micractinium sp. CCAP 211/92]
MDDDGLILNLALPDTGGAVPPSRSQQRKLKWSQQRALKKQAHRQGAAAPSWLGGGRGGRGGSGGRGRGRQQQEQPPGNSSPAPASGQLKGYSLDTYDTAPAASRDAGPVQQKQQNGGDPSRERQQRQQLQARQGQKPSPAPQQHRAKQQPSQQQQQRQSKQQQQQQQRQQQQQQAPQRRPQQEQPALERPSQRDAAQQPPARATQAQGQPRGVQLAAEHNKRRQQRHGPGGAPRCSGFPQPGGEEGGSKRIGRLRLASRQAGYREATPELDDIRAAGSDAEDDDVAAAVAAAVARDRAVERELAASQHARFARFAGDSDNEAGGPAHGGGGTHGVNGAYAPSAAAELDRFAGSSSEEEGEGGAGFVDFGGGDYAEEERRRRAKRRKKEAGSAAGTAGTAAATGQKKSRAGAVSVRPGELVHAGTDVPLAAQGQLFAHSDATAGDGGAVRGGFAGLGLSEQLAAHLAAHGFAQPTRVQQQTIPVLLSKRDALVNAPTGSGKTLSYLAPIVHDLAAQQPPLSRSRGTLAVVICPTRELCLQVADVLTMLVRRFVWLVGGAIHGGEDRGKEKARLRKGVTILVATPGRLLDHLQNTAAFRTEELRWLVLDEADRLLDLGFEKKIAQARGGGVCEELSRRSAEADYAARRTTALLSATLHSNLGSLAALSLHEPAAVGFSYRMEGGRMVVTKAAQEAEGEEGGGRGGAAADAAAARGSAAARGGQSLEQFEIPAQLRQRFVEVPCKLRLVALGALLRARMAAAPQRCKMVVFLSTTDSVEYYHSVFTEAWEPATGERLLQQHEAPILKLHGNMPQGDRTQAFLTFTKCPAGVLLCTDVAARGLDFPAVTDIVQFDPPGEAAEYVHRVGRTARLGSRGDALLFLLPSERGYVEHLAAHGVVLREQPAVPLLNHVLGADRKAGKDLPLERHQGAYALQKQLMEAIAADRHLAALGGDAFRSWVRAYATHASAVKEIFHVRRLHLGHVAHAFALKERPSLVGKSSTKQAVQQKRKAQHAQQGQRKQRGGGSGAQQQNAQHGGKKKPRTAGKQLMSGGGMYNLA